MIQKTNIRCHNLQSDKCSQLATTYTNIFLIYALVPFKTEHMYQWSAEQLHPYENEFRYKIMIKKSLLVYIKGKGFFLNLSDK